MIIKIANKESINVQPSSILSKFTSKYLFFGIKLFIKNEQKANIKYVVEIIMLRVIKKEKIKIIVNEKKEIEIINNKLLMANFKKEIQE
ncbi:HPr family phosphocarrier protein [Borrelia sp. HM]|uniref:HPr family phosphocarrier protein n=1 Tax=Borrelia sp. HM TaxID=1882662 RepID=UPI0021065372|nr:HPr family phosphocarrier protein [Borrelia sp. HM]